MKILLILALACRAFGAWANVQTVANSTSGTCGLTSGTSCTITVASTGANNLAVVEMHVISSTQATAVSGGCSVAWVAVTGADLVFAGSNGERYFYCSSTTAAATSIVVTVANNNSKLGIFFESSHEPGAVPRLEPVPAPLIGQASSATQPGVAFALGGVNDILFESISTAVNVNSINRGFVMTAVGARVGAYLVNTSVGTAPTWTLNSASGASNNGIAFAEAQCSLPALGAGPC